MVFTSDEEARVREIAQQVVYEHLGKMYSKPPENDFIYTSKEFRGGNKELMEAEINEWLTLVQPLEDPKVVVEKDPTSNFALIKTITVKIRKPVTTGSQTPDAESPQKTG